MVADITFWILSVYGLAVETREHASHTNVTKNKYIIKYIKYLILDFYIKVDWHAEKSW